jgi:hypothetical protein
VSISENSFCLVTNGNKLERLSLARLFMSSLMLPN